MIDIYEAVGLVLIAAGAGMLIGHAAGYARGIRVSIARYRRVGRPE